MEIESETKITIQFTGKEIRMLKALAQNPHDNYQENQEIMVFAKELFETLRDNL